MKAITWLASVSMGVAALTSTAFSSTLEGWTTDLDQAFKQAKIHKKSILVEFTGSDWCPPCIALRNNVFSKPEFVTEASKNFILVELDFPKANESLAEINKPYAMKYNVEGFPTIILFNPEGEVFTRFFASDFPSTEVMLKKLSSAYERKDLD
jgi:thiol:disulfide interchange protein